jgi:hypothetical protein
MFGKRLVIWPLATFGAVALLAARPLSGGYVSAGGWTVSWDSSFDNVVGLVPLTTGPNDVHFSAHAQFTRPRTIDGNFEPYVFTFQQTSTTAKQFVVIEQAAVMNDTDVAWGGFGFMLNPPDAGGVKFDKGQTMDPGDPYSIAPFTSVEFSADGKHAYSEGGIVPPGPMGENVWTPGQVSGGLYINGSPSTSGGRQLRSFSLLAAPEAIPLPTAGVAGMSVIGTIGLHKLSRAARARRAA